MSFKLGDFAVDRILYGWATDFDDNLLYTLAQLQNATIDITATSKDVTDKDGTLVKKFWQGKTGTFTATSAMLNSNVIGATSGAGVETASATVPIQTPKFIKVAAGSTATLTDYVEGTVFVNAISTSGAAGKAYTQGTAASASEFSLTSAGILTPPTDSDETLYIVRYQKKSTNAYVIRNKADKFPGTVKLYLKALYIDPCTADTTRSCIIELPSFQPSPEVSLAIESSATLDYKGDLQVDYCSEDKALYNIFFDPEDIEES